MKRYLLILGMCFGMFAIGGEVTVKIIPEALQISEKDELEVTVSVSSDEQIQTSRPQFSDTENFSLVYAGGPRISQSSQMSTINGRTEFVSEYSLVYSFIAKPKKRGSLPLPSVTVNVDGVSYTSAGPVIAVVESNAKNGTGGTASIELQPSAVQCRVGETAELMIVIMVPEGAELSNLNLNFNEQYPELQTEFLENATRKERVIQGGKTMVKLSCRCNVTPMKSGIYELAGPSIQAFVPDTSKQRDFFWGTYPTKRMHLVADSIRMEVNDLPAENRPENFTGMMGEHVSLKVTAEPCDVAVGDPIVLTLRFSGIQPASSNAIPQLKTIAGFENNFRISSEENGVDENGELVFQRTLRVLSDDVTEIPAISIPYFNLSTDAYDTVASAPIALEVKRARSVTLNDAQMVRSGTDDSLNNYGNIPDSGQIVTSRDDGLNDIFDVQELLGSSSRPITQKMKKMLCGKQILLAAVVPPFLWLLVVLAGCMKRSPAAERRRVKRQALPALHHAIGRINPDDPTALEQLGSAVQIFFRNFYGLSSGTITFADVRPLLEKSGCTGEDISKIRMIMGECEAARYGASSSAQDIALCFQTAEGVFRKLK